MPSVRPAPGKSDAVAVDVIEVSDNIASAWRRTSSTLAFISSTSDKCEMGVVGDGAHVSPGVDMKRAGKMWLEGQPFINERDDEQP